MNEYDLIYKVGGAASTLLTYYENKPYKHSIVPVTIKHNDVLKDFNLLVVYEEAKEEEAIKEIEEKFREGSASGFLMPNENYIQIAFGEKKSIFNTYVTFSDTFKADTNEDTYIKTKVIDREYDIINDFFLDWYGIKSALGKNLKSDDIDQAAFVFGVSSRKKESKKAGQPLVKTKK